MEKKVPMRRCVACRESKEKNSLLRVVRDPNGRVFLDESQKKNGRGAYVCKQEACILKAKNSKALQRSLAVAIDSDFFDRLLSEVTKT